MTSLLPIAVKRESKVPNIPSMIRCQNCDTHFPTKYQFQRHQCEFNAEKVVLKPNVDVKDVQKGVRMKFDCPTCGKQFVSKNNLERHLTSHDEDNVNICEYCNKHFVSENRLRIHKENHCKKAGDISKFYRSDVTVWKCVKCYQVFSSDAYANSHADNCNDILDPEDYRVKGLDDDSEAVTLKEEIKSLLTDAPELVEGDPSNLHLITSKYVEKVITELLLQCEYCNKTYSDKKSLLMHQKTHTTETNYNCVVCCEVFNAYTQAGKHWLTKCSNEANLFYLPKLTYCHYCDRTFKSHEVLYSHKIKKKHYTPKRYMSESSPQPPPPDKEENKETIIKLIEDVLCSIKLNAHDHSQDRKHTSEVNSHEVTIKTEAVSETSSLIISEDAPETEGLTTNGKKKRGRKRKHNSQTSKGKRLAANVEPGYKYQCERCIQVFDSVLDLETHRDKEHPANYKCEECDQVVHSSKALLIHSRAHQSLKPYVCEICKRCYSQTSHLWQHMRFHQGIKPFACPHEGCEARYTIRPDLKDHIRKVHTRERPFKCSVCDKCFLTGSVYYQHRLIHTNDRRYACDVRT
ncbi:PREDICTED: zinc finger protein 420-like [Nicrophorus vespilloides]|uniref:Zinc finger protein 420-like n=1 Tax=Nicrophorus vespilloides TaxID=110193 RepID=A0ABM1M0X5_NICVS|nr:PREDICTED: zinc finger protein 420-like [Nicrophorus vespilloides]